MKLPPVLVWSFLLFPLSAYCQFPAICNTPESLESKTCCPNNCGGPSRGSCHNFKPEIVDQFGMADSRIRSILSNTPNVQAKLAADARYMWPTVVFNNLCNCRGNFGGYDCMECDFGWTGDNCDTKKQTLVRKRFDSLTQTEKRDFIQATMDLKNDMGVWSVVVGEPRDYTSGTVTLQNVSTYDFFIHMHSFTARDDSDNCTEINNGIIVDFAHSGPAFPVWHRRYLLIVEKEFQRIMRNPSFAFPYWQWEEDDRSPFTNEHYGALSYSNQMLRPDEYNVHGVFINPQNWNTICDLSYRTKSLNCSDYWKPCNPRMDLEESRPLQRAHKDGYLPNRVEVMMAIAAPRYDAPSDRNRYDEGVPRTSFRSRLEGFSRVCSGAMCVDGQPDMDVHHMHNVVHIWVGGHMSEVPSAINDPIFSLHHCNIDRIFESWLKRFTTEPLPAYNPVSGGHPGHNRDDYMVPFIPLVTAGQQYAVAEEWGYTYDSLIRDDIGDNLIDDCNLKTCSVCAANATCLYCTGEMTCPAPNRITVPTITSPRSPSSAGPGLSSGLGLGIPLITMGIFIISL